MFHLQKIIQTIFLSFLTLLFLSCASTLHKSRLQLPNNKSYAIVPFANYTETTMAGFRASSIVESVLAKQNIALSSLIALQKSQKNKYNSLEENLHQAKELGVDFLIMGNVQEWRYKSGIDGEPVVSYSVKIMNVENHQIVFNAVGAKSGWGHKSIGVVAQEIAQEMLPQFKE